MSMNSADIRHKEFSGKMMGYDKEQVKAYLATLATEWEHLQKQNDEKQELLQDAEENVAHFQNLQGALNKSLIVAQDAADRLKDNAYKESKEIIAEAEEKANEILKEAARKASLVKRDADLIRDAARTFRIDLHELLNKQLDLVESEEWDRMVGADPSAAADQSTPEKLELSADGTEEAQTDTAEVEGEEVSAPAIEIFEETK